MYTQAMDMQDPDAGRDQKKPVRSFPPGLRRVPALRTLRPGRQSRACC